MLARRRQKGFTLVELMVTAVTSTVLLGAAITLYTSNLNHNSRENARVNLYSDMNNAMNYLSKEIRRAGYWYNTTGNEETTNPFTQWISDINISGSGDCIQFSYDKDGNGTTNFFSGDAEWMGFRLSSNVIQFKDSNFIFSCTWGSGWDDLTNASASLITSLSFTLNTQTYPFSGNTVTQRSVTIVMTGQSPIDSSVTHTMTKTVKVMNDAVD